MDDLVKNDGLFGVDFEAISLEEENKILKERLRFLAESVDSMTGVYIRWKDKDGRCLGCNREFSILLGKQKRDIIGKTDAELYPESMIELVETIKRHDFIVIRSRSGRVFTEYYNFGGLFSICIKSIRNPLVDDNGEVIGVVEILVDTSEEEDSLLHHQFSSDSNKIDFQQVLDAIDAHVYWKDVTGRYLGCNSSVLSFNKFKKIKNIVGKTDYDILPEKMADQAIANDAEVMRDDKTVIVEEFCTDNSGRVFMSSKSPLLDRFGQVKGIVGVSIDITERKKLEREAERQNILMKKQDQLKTQFIRNFSHDLSAPISSLKSDFILLRSLLKEDVKVQKLVPRFSRNVDRIETMFLDMRREFLSGVWDVNIREQNFCLSNMLNREFDLLQSCLTIEKSEKLVLKLAIDQAIPAQITGDSVKLGMILRNLLANAVKYTNEGYVELAVELIEKIEHDEDRTATLWLSFAIVDTGIGIPEEHLSDIFCLGFRVNSSYDSNNAPGSGLGLSIVKDYVDLLKGEIIVESTLGKGSKFLVKLSFSSVDDKENHENT
ncbi:hypothetical protein GCM10010995_08490 [Cysteiniphilum litorale]|uniref:histidine kinase n=2 Tax=Fastidiosibacteraceae TaxID=2056687 RepID=A0A8J3E8I0_9GAMM|nr:hypothetical protein GCM10010995_08490 [Cysteiniphilum litorale]